MTRAMVWFRRDLSLEDNLAWSKATVDHAEVLPVYILDRRLLDTAGPYRRRQFIARRRARRRTARGRRPPHRRGRRSRRRRYATRPRTWPTPSTGTTTSPSAQPLSHPRPRCARGTAACTASRKCSSATSNFATPRRGNSITPRSASRVIRHRIGAGRRLQRRTALKGRLVIELVAARQLFIPGTFVAVADAPIMVRSRAIDARRRRKRGDARA